MAAIRAQQMAKMGGGSGMGGMPTQQDQQAAAEKQAAAEAQRAEMLTKVLEPAALERIKRIALVKPEKVRRRPRPPPAMHALLSRTRRSHAHTLTRTRRAPQSKKLEDMVLSMAGRGQLREAITDASLAKMLEQISGQEEEVKAAPVKFDRRRYADDSDSDIDLDGL